MPFARRAASLLCVLGLVPALVASCGGQRSATGFCAVIRRGHPEFDSISASGATAALAEFDRVAASAPPTLAPDLKTVGSLLRDLYFDPASVAKDPAGFARYAAAVSRVDRYLHQTCGVSIPPAGKFF